MAGGGEKEKAKTKKTRGSSDCSFYLLAVGVYVGVYGIRYYTTGDGERRAGGVISALVLELVCLSSWGENTNDWA